MKQARSYSAVALLSVIAGSLPLIGYSSAPASADETIVTTITIAGAPFAQMNGSHKVTTYYSGTNVRTDDGSGRVRIVRGASNNTYLLDTTAKTYFQMQQRGGRGGGPGGAGGGAGAQGGGPGGGPGGQGADPPTLTLTATTDTKTIAGVTATGYTVTGSGNPPRFGGPGGGRGGRGGGQGGQGGGAPAGGGAPTAAAASYTGSPAAFQLTADAPATPAAPTAPADKPKDTITGEVWLTTGITIPTTQQGGGRGNPIAEFARPLNDQVTALKMYPVQENLTITHPAKEDGTTPPPTVITEVVTSVSSASIDSALFSVPNDYTEAQPQFGGGGRGGRGGGQGGGNGGGAPGGGGQGGAPPAN